MEDQLHVMEGPTNEAERKTPSWPRVTNLRSDPWERAPFEGNGYIRWDVDQMWMFVPAQAAATKFQSTFEEYLQSQKVGSLSIDNAVEMLENAQSSAVRQ
jgi:hypothetical protein